MKTQLLCLFVTIWITGICYVQDVYEGEPNNRVWYTGEKERDGNSLFVPGDVVKSDMLQKRTAEYSVQRLVLGIPVSGQVYNAARYSVSVPKKDDNKARGIPVDQIKKRIMIQTTDTFTLEDNYQGSLPLESIYIYSYQEKSCYLYNIHSNTKIEVVGDISQLTTLDYIGRINQYINDISLTLQTTSVRLSYLDMFLHRWNGPISVAIYIKPDEYDTILDYLRNSKFPRRLVVNVVIDSGTDYPINSLRNIAIRSAPSSHFYVSDMDVWPSTGLYSQLIESMNSQTTVGSVMRKDLTAIIVPVYEYTSACSSFSSCVKQKESVIPDSKQQLRKCLQRKTCREFREGQLLHNYYFDELLNDNFTQILTTVTCFVKDKQEPYLILKKSSTLPLFDERFINYGYNKVQWVTDLRYSGYHFYVWGLGFGIDVAHPRGKLQKEFLSTMKEKHVTLNQGLFQSFVNDLLRKKKRSVLKTCNSLRQEVCIDCPIEYD